MVAGGKPMKRREFIKTGVAVGVSGAGLDWLAGCAAGSDLFHISLAQWSLHRSIRDGVVDPLEFAMIARDKFGLEGIEYVNQFYVGRAEDQSYLKEMKNRAESVGVRSLLIMCDNEGRLGDPDGTARIKAVENHYKWVDAAAFLGCHSIRVNAASEGGYDEQMALAADGLSRLCAYGDQNGINVVVENHGGLSSNGEWLTGVIKKVNNPRCGTLPDFGNFRIAEKQDYDRYQGVTEMMPFAKAVSAKSYDFDEQGNETQIDYLRMMRIVLQAGYRGFTGIEYEGNRLSEMDGIAATKNLLIRVREKLAEEFRT
jgi:L-ribulose-5-phosphate 3-epimerase